MERYEEKNNYADAESRILPVLFLGHHSENTPFSGGNILSN